MDKFMKKTVNMAIRMTKMEVVTTILGSILFALGVNWFISPCGTYNGGVLGISQLIYTLVSRAFPSLASFNFTSVLYYILNVPIIYLAYRELGRHYFRRTLLCVTVETVALALIPTPKEMLVDSTLTSVIIGGIIAGAGSGMIFRSRSSAGGTDIIGLVLTKKYKNSSVGKLSIAVNAVIYGICALTLNVSVAIYSIIYSVISSLTIDHMHDQNIVTAMTIFTKKDPHRIISYITSELGHSANYWEATSGYTGEKEYIIYTVVSKYDAHKLDVFLMDFDHHVFAVKNNGVSLDGNFRKKL